MVRVLTYSSVVEEDLTLLSSYVVSFTTHSGRNTGTSVTVSAGVEEEEEDNRSPIQKILDDKRNKTYPTSPPDWSRRKTLKKILGGRE
jgi:hypothetical protein